MSRQANLDPLRIAYHRIVINGRFHHVERRGGSDHAEGGVHFQRYGRVPTPLEPVVRRLSGLFNGR